tara:strand:+ start:720 stop:1100 length:381 start_codon:yes stop_codon:yes gene_type:complete
LAINVDHIEPLVAQKLTAKHLGRAGGIGTELEILLAHQPAARGAGLHLIAGPLLAHGGEPAQSITAQDIGLQHKGGHKRCGGLGYQLLRRRALMPVPAREHRHLITDGQGLFRGMGDHQSGHAAML